MRVPALLLVAWAMAGHFLGNEAFLLLAPVKLL